MLEIIFGLFVCGAMAKIAVADEQSGVLWFCVTFAMCIVVVLFIPLPYIRMLIAGVLAIGAMMGYKAFATS